MSAPALSLQGVSCNFISKDDPGQRYTAVRDVQVTGLAAPPARKMAFEPPMRLIPARSR